MIDDQSSSPVSQPMDLSVSIYASKGKSREPHSTRILGTARDVGNADQWELQVSEAKYWKPRKLRAPAVKTSGIDG